MRSLPLQLISSLTALLALGCPPKNPVGETDGSSSGSGEATTSTPTTDPAPTSTSSGDASDDSSSTSTTADESTQTTDPTGQPGSPCTEFCDRLLACDLDGGFDGCPCESFVDPGPKCAAGLQMTADCFDATSCEELNTGEGPCWDSFMTSYEQCILGEDGCDTFILGGTMEPPGVCTFGEQCLDMPEKLVRCEGDTCTCTIDDVEVGTCPAGNICEDLDPLDRKIAECCGR